MNSKFLTPSKKSVVHQCGPHSNRRKQRPCEIPHAATMPCPQADTLCMAYMMYRCARYDLFRVESSKSLKECQHSSARTRALSSIVLPVARISALRPSKGYYGMPTPMLSPKARPTLQSKPMRSPFKMTMQSFVVKSTREAIGY